MSKRKKSHPVAAKEDGTSSPMAKKVRKKPLRPDEEQNTDTVETECRIVAEGQGTEDITVKPIEGEELVSRSHDIELTDQRTDLTAQQVEDKGCRANGSQDGEHFLFQLSQNSAGKYIPVFRKQKNRLSRSNPARHIMENTENESLNGKVEGDDSSQNMDLESSEFCLPAARHQVPVSQQPPEQIACNTRSAKEAGKEQQGTETDGECVKQVSDGDASLSGLQIGTEHVGRVMEEFTCRSDQKNSDITEVKSNKMDGRQFEMDVLCSAPIPLAHSTADERPLTHSEHKTQDSSPHFSEEEPDSVLLHHSLYQEKTDDVPVTHEELTVWQGVKMECTIAINKDVYGDVESSVLVPEAFKNSNCRKKAHSALVVCEEVTGREVNKQELAAQMNLTTDIHAQSDLKDATCSQPTDLCFSTLHQSLDTSQVVNDTFNFQADTMDRHKNVNEEPPSCEVKLSPAVRNGVLQNVDDYQKGFDGDWSDLNAPCSSRTEGTDSQILHQDSDDHYVEFQQQPSQCFLEDKTIEIECETLHSHQGEMCIASNPENQIIQNFCKSFNGRGINMERRNSESCSNAGEERKRLIQVVLNNSRGNSPVSTDSVGEKCNSAAQSQAGLAEECIAQRRSECSETPLPNPILSYSQTDLLSTNETVAASKSIVAFKGHTGNSCGSEPQLGLESAITGSHKLEITGNALPDTKLNPSPTAAYPTKKEELASEVNGHQRLFDSNCNGKDTKSDKEQSDSKVAVLSTDELKSNMLLSLDHVDFQVEIDITEEKNKVDFGRREIQHKASIQTTNEDVTVTLLLPGNGVEDCVSGCQQADKTKKEIEGGGRITTAIERGDVSINDNQELGVEHTFQSLMGHSAEKETGTFEENFFPVEKMDMELGYDLTAGDVNTLPQTGPNLAALFPQYQSPEDFTKRHGSLSMAFPPTGVEMAAPCSDGSAVNAKSGHSNRVKECRGINSINEGNGRCLSLGSSSKEQESDGTRHVSASRSVNQRGQREQKPSPNSKSKSLSTLTQDEVQPGDKDYELQLIKPTFENKAASLIIAPQEDNANFSSELQDLNLSEADWQAFSASVEEVEDATHVVCGLINELSKINRIIMITHRELETMKRHKHRKVRPVGRHQHIPKGAANVAYSVKRKDL
uniref:uncharacterized protein isoform X2 n=1 Tax=Pristiophorus japonicus TaxID=55135 RepID=UPI00398E9E33